MRKTRCHSLGIVGVALLLLGGQTRPGLCQRTLSDGISDLASQISTRVAQQQKRKIAVIPFRELDGKATVLGTYMSEALVTQLVNSGSLEVVERTMLDRILSEMKLGESGLIDPNTAKRVGQVAGVDAIVTGTITDLQSYVAANCRLIDAATGRIFAAAEARIVKDDDVKKIMGVAMTRAPIPEGPALGQSESRSAQEAAPSRAPAPGPTEWSDRSLRVQTVGVARGRKETEVTLLVTNLTASNMRFQIKTARWAEVLTYLVDEFGNRYTKVAGSIFRTPTDNMGELGLVPNVPIRVRLEFEELAPDVTSITAVVYVSVYTRNWEDKTLSLGPFRIGAQGH